MWIEVGKCRLQDLGDELRIHGPAASDAAVRAMISKAMDEWDSSLEIFGERAFKDAAWLEGQRQGVAVYDQATGKLYEPSEGVRKAFEGDQFRIRSEGDEMSAIRNHRAVAALVLEAAAGDVAALESSKGTTTTSLPSSRATFTTSSAASWPGNPRATSLPRSLPSEATAGPRARPRKPAGKRKGSPHSATTWIFLRRRQTWTMRRGGPVEFREPRKSGRVPCASEIRVRPRSWADLSRVRALRSGNAMLGGIQCHRGRRPMRRESLPSGTPPRPPMVPMAGTGRPHCRRPRPSDLFRIARPRAARLAAPIQGSHLQPPSGPPELASRRPCYPVPCPYAGGAWPDVCLPSTLAEEFRMPGRGMRSLKRF
ncbi:LPD7 domain-containing protein [Mesorhizobium sp. M0136]|uniref:LPD7 domain-containing protein n=1 Tax=Mesorhizobium sp. M0136 TaxID=2956890 RepID=UPI003337B3A2